MLTGIYLLTLFPCFVVLVAITHQAWIELKVKSHLSLKLLTVLVENDAKLLPAFVSIATSDDQSLWEEVNMVDFIIEMQDVAPNEKKEVILVPPSQKVCLQSG